MGEPVDAGELDGPAGGASSVNSPPHPTASSCRGIAHQRQPPPVLPGEPNESSERRRAEHPGLVDDHRRADR